MCGIVGYWGPQKPKKIILDGLRRLEYRGYDSTGVAIFDDGNLQVIRSPGKLTKLEEKIGGKEYTGPAGIGHTRWATHGEPSERNAHPHRVGRVAIVHNGIIENYREIRESLISQGCKIMSDTDSELVGHLLNLELNKGMNLLQATVSVIPTLRGAYSILVVDEKNPDGLLAFKNGTPMLVGLGKNEVVIASDVQAIIDTTRRVVYLEDGEIVNTQNGEAKFTDRFGKPIKKDIVTVDWTPALAEKAGFDHYMQKEIFEQPRALIQTIEPHVKHNPLEVHLKDLGFSDQQLNNVKRIQLIACGTSWHAALIGRYLLEKIAKIPTTVDIASEFRYSDPVLTPDTLVVTVSQSGETADTLACLRHCKAKGLKVLSICNVLRSTIDREADGRIITIAGPEIGVCSTKAFTCQVAALQLLCFHLARLRKSIPSNELESYVQELLELPSQVEVCLNHDRWFKEAAQSLSKFKGFLYLGRGINYPVALEGALKLKEITYLHAEGYPSGEMKHGPIALIDKEMAVVAIAPHDELFEKSVSNIEEVRARGGHIFAIGSQGENSLSKIADRYLAIPKVSWVFNPVLSAIPIQLMSYHMAVQLGRDVDQPRNLAKSVTVE